MLVRRIKVLSILFLAAAAAPSDLACQAQESQPHDLNQIGYDLGSPEASVRVVELSDFGCGYCRLFHQETFPTLL
ncbi:MAG: thioredoxin domain-containing protein, partial [Gemmatimonadota bacterium]